jgi:hypothetical protein
MLTKTERHVDAVGGSSESLSLQEERLALAKLVHRLGEEAGQANIDVLKREGKSDRVLLLVSQGCEALSFTLMALDNFADTEDRTFLGLARDGEALAMSIDKLM